MEKIGRYEVLGKLGQGAFGTVYRGRDTTINRSLAIKVVSESLVGDAAQLARFKREAEAAGGLNHRNIVTIYELGEHEGRPFIAMEYLEGQDLASILAKNVLLPIEREIDILIQVAEGLHYAHQRGIVHRDIKPHNIRLLEDGTAKIMDFGIARTADSNMTNTGLILGTVNYMAPEMLQGQPIDHRADQFSLGVTGYELLVRRKPFSGETISTVLYRIVYEKPLDLTELQTTSYPMVAGIIMRCLEKDVAARWPSCQALAQALRDQIDPRATSSRSFAVQVDDAFPTRELDTSDGVTRAGPATRSSGAVRVSVPTQIGAPEPPGAPTVAISSATLTPRGRDRRAGRGVALAGTAVAVLVAGALFVGYRLARSPAGERGTATPAPPSSPPAATAAPRDPAATTARFQALLEEAARSEAAGELDAARSRYLAILAVVPDEPVARGKAAELEGKIARLGELKSAVSAALDAGDGAAAGRALAQAQELSASDPELKRMREELQRLEARAAVARPSLTPLAAPAARAEPDARRDKVSAAVAVLRPLLAAETIDPGAVEKAAATLRGLDPGHAVLADADRLVQSVGRAGAALGRLDPDAAMAALDGLDPRLAAVRSLHDKAQAQIQRRQKATASLGSARAALATGQAEESAKLARQAAQGWPPLAAEADRVVEQALRAAATPTAAAATPAPTPAPTAAPTAPPAAKAAGDERAAIEHVLGLYSEAMHGKDIGALKRIWPRLAGDKQKTIADSFRFSRDHRVELTVTDLKLEGDTAIVTCGRNDRIETNDGQKIENRSKAVFELRNTGGTWEIVDLR